MITISSLRSNREALKVQIFLLSVRGFSQEQYFIGVSWIHKYPVYNINETLCLTAVRRHNIDLS